MQIFKMIVPLTGFIDRSDILLNFSRFISFPGYIIDKFHIDVFKDEPPKLINKKHLN
ncbi:hypothetical protein [Desmospora activa]|uniref:hypothetical protein n=1 Tax=Desmospora activa TaxID=500615 RepID=UPI0014759BA3|nr:hypothetical protein [Desmospora activa]